MERMRINWSSGIPDVKPAMERYQTYLGVKGLKPNTIRLYMQIVRIYLTTIGYDQPSDKDAIRFCDGIQDCLSRSTRNNYSAALGHYHTMIGKPMKFPFVKVNNILPYFFDEYDVQRIFNVCKNIKHLAMLKILFFGCLRSSELANLNMQDYDSSGPTLRLRETKNGSDAIVYLVEEAASILNMYLSLRPPISVDGKQPLFFTDFSRRWTAGKMHRMFMYYKEKAGVQKKGSLHYL